MGPWITAIELNLGSVADDLCPARGVITGIALSLGGIAAALAALLLT